MKSTSISTTLRLLALALSFLTRCLAAPAAAEAPVEITKAPVDNDFSPDPSLVVSDPIQGVNRKTFHFNDQFYTHVAKPVAHGYQCVVPHFAQVGLTNFFDNLQFPARFVGSLLQAKVQRAGKETEKFIINVTAGVGGFVRVSDKVPSLVGVPEEDIGQAFGVWGLAPGAYFVVPLMGPNNVRDFIGGIADGLLNPIDYLSLGTSATLPIGAVDTVQGLPKKMAVYDMMTRDAIDPYIAVRGAFMSHRAAEVAR